MLCECLLTDTQPSAILLQWIRDNAVPWLTAQAEPPEFIPTYSTDTLVLDFYMVFVAK